MARFMDALAIGRQGGSLSPLRAIRSRTRCGIAGPMLVCVSMAVIIFTTLCLPVCINEAARPPTVFFLLRDQCARSVQFGVAAQFVLLRSKRTLNCTLIGYISCL